MRWLAAKTPELGKWGWGPISNGDAIDTLRERMMDIVDDLTKILNEDFMMNMFGKYVAALPPFKEYWEHLYKKKRMRVVAAESGATVMQFAELRKELFHPSDATNAATSERLVELAKVAAQAILNELHDEKKQHGNICPYRDLKCPFRDARRRSRRDCMGATQQTIGVRVRLAGQLISCKNMAVSGYPMQRPSAMPRQMATSAGFW
jgi:hypothetical protein